MADMCGDNRFEIIAKAKKALLEGTNIETDEAEMAVLDNILFRCWQMGWLDRYDTADTSQTDKDKVVCPNCGRSDYIRSFEKDFNIMNSGYRYKCINCNTYIKDTPQTERSE